MIMLPSPPETRISGVSLNTELSKTRFDRSESPWCYVLGTPEESAVRTDLKRSDRGLSLLSMGSEHGGGYLYSRSLTSCINRWLMLDFKIR